VVLRPGRTDPTDPIQAARPGANRPGPGTDNHMTDLIPPADDAQADEALADGGDGLANARRIAAAHTSASRDLEAFLRRVPATPTAADLAEYAALLAREEAVRADRAAAADSAGLATPSLGTER
jgi:hypothetical protein